MALSSRYRLKAALAARGYADFTKWLLSKQGAHPCAFRTAQALLYDPARARKYCNGDTVSWLVRTLCHDSGLSRHEVQSALYGTEFDAD